MSLFAYLLKLMSKSAPLQVVMSLINSILISLLKNHVYTIKSGVGRGFKRKGYLGFIRVDHGLTAEERFLLSLDLRGKTVYDIGGYVGIVTMFFARSVGNTGKVITFEPNPENCVKLRENLALNDIDNVELINFGLGDKRETRTLVVCSYESATGSMEQKIASRMLKKKGTKCFQIEVYPLDSYIELNRLPKPDFVKIDVEGMEYNVLLGMKNAISRYKPSLFIEIHGVDEKSKIDNVHKFVEFLDSHGYSIYHVESKQAISTTTAHIAKEGHLFCAQSNTETIAFWDYRILP
jgi:FkbM family methyltransferase